MSSTVPVCECPHAARLQRSPLQQTEQPCWPEDWVCLLPTRDNALVLQYWRIQVSDISRLPCDTSTHIIWPASREKGPSNIRNSVRSISAPTRFWKQLHVIDSFKQQEIYVPLVWRVSESADPDQTRRRRRSGWSGSTLFVYVQRSLFAWRWPYYYMQCRQWGIRLSFPWFESVPLFAEDLHVCVFLHEHVFYLYSHDRMKCINMHNFINKLEFKHLWYRVTLQIVCVLFVL